MHRLSPLLCAILLLAAAALPAQGDVWTLERAVNYALENNLQIRQAENNIRASELFLRQDQLSRMPNLSGSTSAGFQFGRTIDPTTNTFNNERITFNSYQLQAGATIFSGGLINNQVEQSTLNLQVARLDAETTRNNIALNVANAYLNVLLAREQLGNARATLTLTEAQLDQTETLIRAGSLPEADRLDIVAQRAQNEGSIIELENLIITNELTLKQLLQLDPAAEITIPEPDFEIGPEELDQIYTLEEVYNAAVQTQPVILSNDLRVQSAQVGEQIARAGFFPTLSVFGGLNTNYSSAARDFNNPDESQIEYVPSAPQQVIINGQEISVQFVQPTGIIYPNKSFGDQINENFGQNFGLNLQVPIYSRGQNRIAVQQAQVQTLNAQVQRDQARQQLRADVQQALANYRAGRLSYLAAERSVEAAETSFQNAQRRYDLGTINTFEYTQAANRLELARIDQTRAKYQLLFNQKVVQFYLGQELNLD